MTKLYCPKGHETENLKNEFSNTVGFLRLWCSECARPYLEMDCLTEPNKEKMVNPHQIKAENVNDIDVVESKVIPSEMQWVNPKRESQIAIDRVVEALRSVCKSANINGLSNLNVLDSLIVILEELNK